MAELPRWVLTHAEKLNNLALIRVDLDRSLRRHRWLVFGVTGAGATLAALYLATPWPDKATPAQLVAIVLNAVMLPLLAFVIGMAAAVVLQSLDRRVYDRADIKYLLGVEPMVELPDLGELSSEETRDLLLPLAGGIIHACPDDALRRCIFTGAGPGTGVTAIAARTKETLEAIGRRVVLMDAAGATPGVPDAEIGGDEAKGDGGGRRESLILTETAPLVSSADTEYLARFADCVIVVAESEVTTREQLRDTVKCLQRLNVVAVGFVLNGVKEAKAGAELRRSAAAPDISSAQFPATVQQALQQPSGRAEIAAKAAPRPQPAASLTRGRETPRPAGPLSNVKREPQSSAWEQPGIPRWMSEALGEFEAPHLGQTSGEAVTTPAEKSRQQIAAGDAGGKPLEMGPPQATLDREPNGIAARLDQAGAQVSSQNSEDPNGGNGIKPENGQATSPPVVVAPSGRKPSRLSGLRGIVSAAHLRELKRLQDAADETNLQPGDARPEGAKNDLPSAGSEASHGSPARLGDLRGLITAENLKDLNQARQPLPGAGAAVERGNGPERHVPESAPPAGGQATVVRPVAAKVAHPLGDPEQTSNVTNGTNGAEATPGARDAEVPAKPTVASDRDRVAPYEDVQILPSRRGQYRQKK